MKVYLKNDNPLSEAYLRYADMLEKSNKYDCIIMNTDMTDEILESNKNILLLERLDCSSIWCRELLKHPHVKTLLKMYHRPILSENNEPAVDKRIFIEFDGSEKPQTPELTAEDMKKVQPGFNFFHYSRFDSLFERLKSVRLKPSSERSVFAFFAGTTVYDESKPAGKWITGHRKKCLRNLEAMKAAGHNIIIADHRAFNNSKYIDIMLDTKIIFSPFGWGEFCYRDYEALLCGCNLIKPDMGHIDCVPYIQHEIMYFIDSERRANLEFAHALRKEKENEKQILERILA